jgi:hypothetical protein
MSAGQQVNTKITEIRMAWDIGTRTSQSEAVLRVVTPNPNPDRTAASLAGPSDDLQLAGSNVVVCGGLFTIAMPSYWYMRQYMHQKDVACNLPMPEPTPSS